MGIPFKITTEGMKYTYEPRSEAFRFVVLVEHPGDNGVDGLEETVKKRSVFKEPVTYSRVYCKDTVAVFYIDNLKGHTGCSVY